SYLLVEVRDLRLELLDARMAVEQGRGLLGKLRPQRHALFVQSADQLRIDHVGVLDRRAALEHIADELCLRFEIRLLRARRRKIAIRFAERLARQRGAVAADEKIGLGAKFLDFRLGLRDALAQDVDLATEPAAGGPGLLLPGDLLEREVVLSNRV